MGECSQNVDVRLAAEPDLPHLVEIWREMMDEHAVQDPHFSLATDASQKWMQATSELLRRDDAFLFKALAESRGVGFCLGWVAYNPPIYQHIRVGFVSEVAVFRSVRRRGVGRALIKQARLWFAERDLDHFQLSTAVWNKEACSFWEAIGGKPLLLRYRFATVE